MKVSKKSVKINSKAIVVSIIAALDMFINIYNTVRESKYGLVIVVIMGIVLALCDMFTLYAVIEIANKPVRGIALLTLSQLLTFVYDIIDGATTSEALSDMGIIGLFVIAALIYNIYTANKNNKGSKTVNSEKRNDIKEVKNKMLSIINYERPIYSVKIYVRVIIYCLIISSVMSLSQSEMLTTLNSDTFFRIYSALVVTIPIFLVLGIITTSYIAYDLFVIKLLVECYTVFTLISINNFDIIQIIYIIVEVITIVYAYYYSFKVTAKKK